jgi:multidrug transporter EmrE-like cation transporter
VVGGLQLSAIPAPELPFLCCIIKVARVAKELIVAFQDLPGFVVFPIASAGCLILTAIVATQLLDERLSRKTHVGIVLASVALVLLNWLPDS